MIKWLKGLFVEKSEKQRGKTKVFYGNKSPNEGVIVGDLWFALNPKGEKIATLVVGTDGRWEVVS